MLLGLAIAVFTWGLEYKLSLYDPPQAISHRMPEAKLLSREEQVTKSVDPLLDTSSATARKIQLILSSIFVLISLVLSTLHVSEGQESIRTSRISLHLRLFACLNAFFFRPPPVLA